MTDAARCTECGCLLPAHYGSCSTVDQVMKDVFASLDADAAKRRERDAERNNDLASMQHAGRERMRGKLRAMSMDTKLQSFDRDVLRNMIMLSDGALDALSIMFRN